MLSFHRHILAVVAAVALLAATAQPSLAGEPLAVSPASIRFEDAHARSQLLVGRGKLDATQDATYASSNPEVVRVDESGYVAPVGVGQAEVHVEVDGEAATVQVQVTGLASDRPVDFVNEIEPLLTRSGCNSGGCHGKASGQNGFKLSLFGFDAAFDYEAIVTEARGRRVFPAAPERSLLLVKAAAEVPHGGGRRLDPAGEPYRVLTRWIAQGMPHSSPDAAKIESLSIEPAQRALQPAQTQQLRAIAHYNDGSAIDVTRQAQYDTNLDVVASAGPTGLVRAGEERGEAAIMVRYMGQVAVFRALVPLGPPLLEIAGFEPANYIDELVLAKWKQTGLQPSPATGDSAFLRRVTLDICGRLPTVDEARAFLAEAAPDKRERLVDRLLDSPDYAAFFALRWGSILRNSNLAGSNQAAYAFHNWIKDSIARNTPYDQFVRGIVAAAGEWQDAPAINWYWQSRDDQLHQVTADTAQVFLGLRLQCARCHHHPYERWSQDDYYGLAGFFTRLGRKSFGEPPPYYAAANVTTGEKHPRTQQTPLPKYLDGAYAEFGPDEDPRHALVDWMARSDNPYFARTLVNRLWGHFLGRGLVHEVDDMRASNPPSNPELLDALSADFIAGGYDVKRTIRAIATSRVYQLDSAPTESNRPDRQNYARFYARRLIAEVFLDAVDQACGTRTAFGNVSSSARAVDLPHENFGSYFLDTFDRPRRVTSCECERSPGATMGQVLLMANSDEIENKVAAGDGRIARLLAENRGDLEIADDIYLAAFSRLPRADERSKILGYVGRHPNRREALEDVLWAVLNSREFTFNY